jgi:membrane protein implicated in regulation of membrane protease activity
MDISVWWDTLTTLQKIHWWIAIPSTAVFLVQMIMMLVAGADDVDADFDADGDFDGDMGDGMNLFSIKSIIAFLMFYGWSGLAAIQYGITAWWVITLIALGIGFLMMLFTAWLLFMLTKLQESGTMQIDNAIGQQGEVYLTIPAKKEGTGKIQVVVQGSLRTLDAVTEETEDIKTGSFVEVVDVINGILVVKRKR